MWVEYLAAEAFNVRLIAAPIEPSPEIVSRCFQASTRRCSRRPPWPSATVSMLRSLWASTLGQTRAVNGSINLLRIPSVASLRRRHACSRLAWLGRGCGGAGLLLDASGGQAFVLFTSYKLLKSITQIRASHATARNAPFWCRATNTEGPAGRVQVRHWLGAFGTDSFWEGVDVPGQALSCVIIPAAICCAYGTPSSARVDSVRAGAAIPSGLRFRRRCSNSSEDSAG